MKSNTVNYSNRMKVICVVFIVVLISSFGQVNGQVERETIDTIMRSNSLNDTQISDIKAFITQRIDAMAAVKTPGSLNGYFLDLVETTHMITGRTEDRKKYSDAFAQTVKASYKKLLNRETMVTNRQLSDALKLQAVIIVARVDHVMMIDDLLGFADDNSPAVRYWAVNGLTMRYVKAFLQGKDAESIAAMDKVVTTLESVLLREQSGMVISKIAQAVLPNNSRCIELIKNCATKRIEQYTKWNVDNEQYDLEILNVILKIIDSGQLTEYKRLETELMRSASTLYSAALLRLTTGKFYRMPDKQKMPLLTVNEQLTIITLLVEGEKGFNKISGRELTSQLGSVFDNNWTIESVTEVHDKLLGPAGPVQRMFKIHPPGQENIKLAALSEPSIMVIARAVTLNFMNNPDNVVGSDM